MPNNNVMDIIEVATREIRERIDALSPIRAEKLGLDPRCGSLYYDDEAGCIIVEDWNRRRLDYYGGFEYVDPDNVTVFGKFAIYDANDSRVEAAIGYFEDNHSEQELANAAD